MADEKEVNSSALHVVVFAGPNGSGKTSLINEIRETGLKTLEGIYPLPKYFINPDQVAKDLTGDFPNQNARDIAAQNAATRMRDEAKASKLPFAFETVMSHQSRINEMLMLKEQGYRLFLAFITTDDPEKNVARVTMRFQTGTTTGHYVSPNKVRDRYERTLALLPRAAELADAVYIYDNSTDFKKPTLQAVIERGGQFQVATDAKEWVKQRLVNPVNQRGRELTQLVAKLEKDGHKVDGADELDGAYKGGIILKTSNYLAQFDETTKQAVIHDRLMLDTGRKGVDQAPPTYSQYENLTIKYSRPNAPEVERHGKISKEAIAQQLQSKNTKKHGI